MLEVKFLCSHCSSKILVDESGFGANINCPHCNHAMVAPVGRHNGDLPVSKKQQLADGLTVADLSILKRQQKRLEESIGEKIRRIADVDRAVALKEEEHSKWQRRLDEQQQRHQEHESQVNNRLEVLKRDCAEQEARMKELIQSIHKAEQDSTEALARLSSLVQEQQGKESELVNLDKRLALTSKELSAGEMAVSQARVDLNKLETASADLKADCEEKMQLLARQKMEMLELQPDLERLRSEHQRALSQHAHAIRELESVQAVLLSIKTEFFEKFLRPHAPEHLVEELLAFTMKRLGQADSEAGTSRGDR